MTKIAESPVFSSKSARSIRNDMSLPPQPEQHSGTDEKNIPESTKPNFSCTTGRAKAKEIATSSITYDVMYE